MSQRDNEQTRRVTIDLPLLQLDYISNRTDNLNEWIVDLIEEKRLRNYGNRNGINQAAEDAPKFRTDVEDLRRCADVQLLGFYKEFENPNLPNDGQRLAYADGFVAGYQAEVARRQKQQ